MTTTDKQGAAGMHSHSTPINIKLDTGLAIALHLA